LRRFLLRQLANAYVDTKPLAIILELNTGLFKRREDLDAPSPEPDSRLINSRIPYKSRGYKSRDAIAYERPLSARSGHPTIRR
jgi:hypothetical protein